MQITGPPHKLDASAGPSLVKHGFSQFFLDKDVPAWWPVLGLVPWLIRRVGNDLRVALRWFCLPAGTSHQGVAADGEVDSAFRTRGRSAGNRMKVRVEVDEQVSCKGPGQPGRHRGCLVIFDVEN